MDVFRPVFLKRIIASHVQLKTVRSSRRAAQNTVLAAKNIRAAEPGILINATGQSTG
jgi:hypothetical protein